MFEEIKVRHRIDLAARPSDVDALEATLSSPMPSGYREYVTRFGSGDLGGRTQRPEGMLPTDLFGSFLGLGGRPPDGPYLRVSMPRDVPDATHDWRHALEEHWFWDAPEVIARERAAECAVFAYTVVGDTLAFHPDAPDRIFIFPRRGSAIHAIDGGLVGVIDWLFTAGVLEPPINERIFTPDGAPPNARINDASPDELRAVLGTLMKTNGLSSPRDKGRLMKLLKETRPELMGREAAEVADELLR